MTNEEMTRAEAIKITDRTHREYVENIRNGVCVSCECIGTSGEVEKQPEHALHEAAMGRESDGYVQFQFTHAEDCRFMATYRNLPALAGAFNIGLGVTHVAIRMPNGRTWVDFAPIRVPGPGDPPVAYAK